MKKYLSILVILALAMVTAAGCGQQDSGASSSSDEQTSQVSVPEASDETSEIVDPVFTNDSTGTQSEVSQAEASLVTSSAGSDVSEYEYSAQDSDPYNLKSMSHPDACVGKWSLRLDTSELEASDVSAAKIRMETTSMTFKADGTVVGVNELGTTTGYWGAYNGCVYVTMGGYTEEFTYYVDTLVSTAYKGMSFVK